MLQMVLRMENPSRAVRSDVDWMRMVSALEMPLEGVASKLLLPPWPPGPKVKEQLPKGGKGPVVGGAPWQPRICGRSQGFLPVNTDT